MQSKLPKYRVFQVKTLWFAAPCLLGVTALSPLLSSIGLTPWRFASSTSLKFPPTEAQQTLPLAASRLGDEKSPSISAEPLNKSAIASSKGISSNESAVSKINSQTSSTQPTAASRPKPVQKTASQPSSASASEHQSLVMQSFAPEMVNDVPEIPIRVAVVLDASNLVVSSSESGIITDEKGSLLGNFEAQSALNIFGSQGGIQVGTIQSNSPVWIRSRSDQGLIYVNGQWYRGAIQIVPDQGAVTVVNHVEMQPYLYSVVGAEMYRDWPAEALKAQAIAARSYALVHIVRPAHPYYDLGSTQRWQAYKGIESESSTTLAAVNDTKGVVISHQGGVVESLYASSEDLVRDAHRGFGMSQYGARDLAQQSLNYSQILSRFYPGTQLSMLQVQ